MLEGVAEKYDSAVQKYTVRVSCPSGVGAFVSDSNNAIVNSGPTGATDGFYMLCERADVHKVRNSLAHTMWSAAIANADQVAHYAALLVQDQYYPACLRYATV